MLSHGTSSGATCSLHHQHHDHTPTPTHPWPSIMPYLVVVIHPRHSRGIGAPAGPTPIFTHITPFASAHAGMTATAQVMFWGCCSRKHLRNEVARLAACPRRPPCRPRWTALPTPTYQFRPFFRLVGESFRRRCDSRPGVSTAFCPVGHRSVVQTQRGDRESEKWCHGWAPHTHAHPLPHHPPPRSTVMFKDTPKIPKVRNLRVFDNADRFFCAL